MFTFALWGAVAAAAVFGYVWITLDQKGLFQIPEREPGIMLLASNGTKCSPNRVRSWR